MNEEIIKRAKALQAEDGERLERDAEMVKKVIALAEESYQHAYDGCLGTIAERKRTGRWARKAALNNMLETNLFGMEQTPDEIEALVIELVAEGK